jgi:hypothetical protein
MKDNKEAGRNGNGMFQFMAGWNGYICLVKPPGSFDGRIISSGLFAF